MKNIREKLNTWGSLLVIVAVVSVFVYYSDVIFRFKSPVNSDNKLTQTQQTKKEPLAQSVNDKNPTAANTLIINGAIAKAIIPPKTEDLTKEAINKFGIHIFSSEVEKYLQFKKRLLANESLLSALKDAKNESVIVLLSNEFNIGTGLVKIDISVDDDNITKFLKESVPIAKAKNEDYGKAKQEAIQYGIVLWPEDVGEYKQFRKRLLSSKLSSKKMASVFKLALDEKIYIYLDNKFEVGERRGWVRVDIYASDEEIIRFLLGE